MKMSVKDLLSKCHQIPNFLWIWSYLRKISLMENFFVQLSSESVPYISQPFFMQSSFVLLVINIQKFFKKIFTLTQNENLRKKVLYAHLKLSSLNTKIFKFFFKKNHQFTIHKNTEIIFYRNKTSREVLGKKCFSKNHRFGMHKNKKNCFLLEQKLPENFWTTVFFQKMIVSQCIKIKT